MSDRGFPPFLLRLAKRYNLFLVLGIAVVASALALGAWEAQALATLRDGGGATDGALLDAARTEAFLRVVIPAWNFAGLGLLTFGIGMSVVVIIHNINNAATEAIGSYHKAFPGHRWRRPPVPRFVKAFPVLLLVGLVLVFANLAFALTGGLAAARVAELEAAGLANTPAWTAAASWAAFAEVLRTPQRPGTMAFIVLGIGLSLATIVYNLRAQNRALPHLKRALVSGKPAATEGPVTPSLPRLPFALLGAGLALVLFASYPLGYLGATARSELVAGGASLDGATRLALLDRLAWTTSLFPVFAVLGIVTILAGIVYWLLLIVHALRDQRALVARMGANLAGTPARPVEQAVWPEIAAGYLAGGGVLTLVLLFLPAVLLAWSRTRLPRLQGAGSDALFDATFLANVLGALVPDLRFAGMALVMLAIGLALGAIVINLTGIGSVLAGTMAGIMRASREGAAPVPPAGDQGDVEARSREAMARFPVRLFVPLLVGALIFFSTTFPLVVPLHLTIQTDLVAALAAGNTAEAARLAKDAAILGALREPWNFVGMGLIFFAIGRFFGTIIGFVQGRRTIITEACTTLAALHETRAGTADGPEPTP